MQTWVVLLRGINVGGKNLVSMAELRQQLVEVGFTNVRSYIQSGNLVLQSKSKSASSVSKKVAACLKDHYGFECSVLSLTGPQLIETFDQNPFAKAEKDPKSTHFFFLSGSTSGTAARQIRTRLTELASPSERLELRASVLYLYAPDGIGRSKLAARAEKLIGVPTTARNYRTVCKLIDMAKG